MADMAQIWPLVTYRVSVGGTAVIAAFGPLLDGFIVNPANASDQGLALPEALYVDVVTTASAQETGTTVPLQPGDTFRIPPGTLVVSINAASSGHRFAGVVVAVRQASDYTPKPGPWPPSGPTTLTAVIPSYLYLQYNDDEDLQEFVDAYNAMAQQYMTWFVTILLPIYTSPTISGTLLDWVAEGLYGLVRPSLPSGISQTHGPINTYQFNTHAFNLEESHGPSTYYLTTDDVFRRILTWHLWKGDGKIFDVRWLKRRIQRFLTGTDGGPGDTDQTYEISVTFGAGNDVNINLQSTRRYSTGGAVIGAGMFNTFMMNELITTSVNVPISPLVPTFKAAVEGGFLELPFQFNWIINT